jgi:hypothetical protein
MKLLVVPILWKTVSYRYIIYNTFETFLHARASVKNNFRQFKENKLLEMS